MVQGGPGPNVLYVGTLAGDESQILESRAYIRTSAIVHGRMLAAFDPHGSGAPTQEIALVDVASGRTRTLLADDPTIVRLAIAPDGLDWYWVRKGPHGIKGVWRQPIAGGPTERINAGWHCSWDPFGTCYGGMVFSADGHWLALDGLNAPIRVIDTTDRSATTLHPGLVSDVLGFLGSDLIIDEYQPCPAVVTNPNDPILTSASTVSITDAMARTRRDTGCGAGRLLDAIDIHTGAKRALIDRGGVDGAIYQTRNGPVLIRDGPDQDGWAQIWARDDVGGSDRPLYRAAVPYSWRWLEPGIAIGLGALQDTSVEISGWVPVLQTRSGASDFDIPIFGGVLVNVLDGTVVEVPTVGGG